MRIQALSLVSILLVACGSQVAEDSFDDLAGLTDKSDSFSKKIKIVGSLSYGESASAQYKYPPTYIAWKFAGQPGDVVDATVTSANGAPRTWLLDNAFRVLDAGDDHVSATLAGNTNPDIVTYYVVVRERWYGNATFDVQLSKKIDPMFACKRDTDCTAVFAGGCCPNGTKVAVNQAFTAAYADAHQCTAHPHPICPLALINDTRQAECNGSTGACEMVKIEDIACNGFTANPHICPTGYQCQLDPHLPDVGGRCVEQPVTPICGGIAGRSCPTGQHCQYDPSVCDPAHGGADCAGTCVADPIDCRASGCAAGRKCSFCWGSYQCIPSGAQC